MPRHRRKAKPAPSKRRTRGTGAFFQSPTSGWWIGRVIVNGTTYERRARTAGELQAKLAAVSPPGPGTTVGEWAERWYADLMVRDSTREQYRNSLDLHILPTLGSFPLAAVTASHVEHAVRVWSARLGANTLRTVLGHLHTCLESARRAGVVDRNPVADAKKPRGKRRVINVFTPEELARIIAASTGPRRIFALLASVGCRLGEALALDVADLDAVAGTVGITKTYSRKHGSRPPKSENGVRTIRIPSAGWTVIRIARKTGPLFPDATGGRWYHQAIIRMWRKFLAELGLAHRNPHQLRHSCISALVAAGVPVPDVAKFVGDSVGTLYKVYVHATGTDPARAMERLLMVRQRGRG